MKPFVQCLELLMRKERLQIVLLLIASLALALLETISIAAIIPLLRIISNPDGVQSDPILSGLTDFLAINDTTQLLAAVAGLLLLLFVLKNILLFALAWWRLRFIQRTRMRISVSLLRAYLYAPYISHMKRTVPEQIRNMLTSVAVVFNGVVLGTVEFIAELLVVIGIITFLFVQDFQATLTVTLVLLPISVGIFLVLRQFMARLGRRTSDLNHEILHNTTQALSGMKDIKVLRREEAFVGFMEKTGVKLVGAQVANQLVSHLPRPVIETVVVAALLLLVITLTGSGGENEDTLTLLGLYAAAAFRLTPSAGRILQSANNIRFSSRVVDDVHSDYVTFHLSPDYKESREAAISFDRSLDIEGVSYVYDAVDQPVINDLNLKVVKGRSLGIVGGSGAGKSTLAGLVLGLLEPSAGSIKADGVDIWTGIRSWRRQIGYVPQDLFVLSESVRRNVAFGYEDDEIDDDRIREALAKAQLLDFVERLPDGLDTMLGENGIRLSGGQRQRIGIARALYGDPSILVLDEATSSLDNETEQQVSRAIQELTEKVTIVIIAHRLTTVRQCDDLIFMESGRIAGRGTYDSLLATNESFQRMVKATEGK